ncbi:MAG: YeeE/YedE family protein [Thermotogota bacterium]
MLIITGLVMGIIFGSLLHFGKIRFNLAFRNIFFFRDPHIFKMLILIVTLESIYFHIFAQLGFLNLNPLPMNWVANPLGGIIMGIGVAIAGGCAGITYRSGEGITVAIITLVSYAFTIFFVSNSFIMEFLSKFEVTVNNVNELFVETSGPSLHSVMGISPWGVLFIASIISIIYIFLSGNSKRKGEYNWKIIANITAFSGVVAYMLSHYTGRDYGYAITGGWENVMNWIFGISPLGWEGFEVLGIVLGAFLISRSNNKFRLVIPKNKKVYWKFIFAGFLIGFGSTIANGCTTGHFWTGLPQFSISSIITLSFLLAANYLTNRFILKSHINNMKNN